MKKILCLCVIMLFIGCTDASVKQFTTLGSKATIICYSGGKVIYEGKSTGKIKTEQGGDGNRGHIVSEDVKKTN